MLKPKQNQFLKQLAHNLQPVVLIGKRGITDTLIDELECALLAHELIKIKFQEAAVEELDDMLATICTRTNAHLAQHIGHVAVLYKAHPKTPKIKLPR